MPTNSHTQAHKCFRRGEKPPNDIPWTPGILSVYTSSIRRVSCPLGVLTSLLLASYTIYKWISHQLPLFQRRVEKSPPSESGSSYFGSPAHPASPWPTYHLTNCPVILAGRGVPTDLKSPHCSNCIVLHQVESFLCEVSSSLTNPSCQTNQVPRRRAAAK